MKVTIKDIAQKAGVSYQTVSKALSGKGSVNESTAENIRNIAKELGYIPSLAARSMTTKKSQLIAVFLPQIASSFYNQFIQGIESLAIQHDYSMLLYLFQDADLESKLETIISYRVEGIIIFENHFSLDILERFAGNQIPVLFVNSTNIPSDANLICIDGYYGLKSSFEHLYHLGHRHFLLALSDHEAEMKRIEDIKKIANEYDITLKTRIYCDSYSSAEVLENFKIDDIRQGDVTAVICTSDYLALPIMTKLQQHGVNIPMEVSIIGFDDLEFAAYLNPPLTTVEQPKRSFGEKIFQTLLGLLRGEANQRITILPKLLVRGTTAQILS